MQYILGLALVFLDQLVIDLLLLPALERLGLSLGQTASHGEFGLGEIQGQIIILGHLHIHSKLYFNRLRAP